MTKEQLLEMRERAVELLEHIDRMLEEPAIADPPPPLFEVGADGVRHPIDARSFYDSHWVALHGNNANGELISREQVMEKNNNAYVAAWWWIKSGWPDHPDTVGVALRENSKGRPNWSPEFFAAVGHMRAGHEPLPLPPVKP